MAKKRMRSKYTSKGQRKNVSKKIMGPYRSNRTFADEWAGKLEAWAKGLPVNVTIENPNKEETNRKFITIPLTQYIGHYKPQRKMVPGKGEVWG